MKLGSTLTEVFKSASSTKHLTSDGKTGMAKSWSIASSPALKPVSPIKLSWLDMCCGWMSVGNASSCYMRTSSREDAQGREGEICEDVLKHSFE